MQPAVIKAFMASVGFQADEKSLKTALSRLAAFGAAIKLAAAAAQAVVIKAAQGEAELARQAERLGTTTEKLREMEYAAEASGLSLDKVSGAMETLLKKNPRIKDGARALELVSARMKGLSEAQRRMYAQKLGLDTSLIPMLTSDLSALRGEFQSLYAASGMDGKRAAAASKGLIAEWGKPAAVGKLLGKSALPPFMERLRDKLAQARKWLMANGESVRAAIAKVMDILGRLSDRTGQVITFLVKGFSGLSESGKGLVKFFALLAGAVALAFSPVLLLAVIIGGLLLLLEDFKTWEEGGGSLFNWQWVNDLREWFDDLLQKWEALKSSIVNSSLGRFLNWDKSGIYEEARTPADFYDASADFFAPPGGEPPLGPSLSPSFAYAPGGSGGDAPAPDRGVTVNAHTEIRVESSDPVAAGREAARQQDRVNADLLRNARAAAR
jgi:hypothetical protein